jgi:hypothetical protein
MNRGAFDFRYFFAIFLRPISHKLLAVTDEVIE